MKKLWKALFVGLLVLALGGSVVFRLVKKQEGEAGRYVTAETLYSKWTEEGDREALVALQELLKTAPSLNTHYQGVIAQRLFAEEGCVPQMHFIKTRVKKPHFSLFSQTSARINEGLIDQGLEEAVALKEQMLQEASEIDRGHACLFLFNLLRIAFLNQKLGRVEQERLAWEELDKYAQMGGIWSDELQKINAHFSEKNLTLQDYIAERRNAFTSMQ